MNAKCGTGGVFEFMRKSEMRKTAQQFASLDKDLSQNATDGKTWGGFSAMLEYEAYQKHKHREKEVLPLTIALCLLFMLSVGSIIFVFCYAYQAVTNATSAPVCGNNVNPSSQETASLQENSASTDMGNAAQEQSSVLEFLKSVAIKDCMILREAEVANEQHSLIGIEGAEIPQEEAALYHIPAGVLVCNIAQDSVAFSKGLRRTDIIESLNGARVYNMQQLVAQKEKYMPGQEITLVVFRTEGTCEITFTLERAE